MATMKRKAEALTASATDLKKPKKDSSLTSFFGPPKVTTKNPSSAPSSSPNGVTAEAPVPKFDKDKWVSTLTSEQKQLLKLEIDTLDPSWIPHLKEELVSREFLELKRFLQREVDSSTTIFPPLAEVYSWSRHTPLYTVKAVILGQDPYHNHNQAHGLCFSVRPPTAAPPSLKNMYQALKIDYPSFMPPPNNGGLLTPWAEQGVLMLNTCLTVRAHEANSHSGKGWERFTDKVIAAVCKARTRGVVFLAWGTPAQKRCASIKSGRHLVLRAQHPSPLSAHRPPGFANCGHFKKTNEYLIDRYGEEGVINWNLNKPKPIAAPKAPPPVVAVAEKDVVVKDGPVTELPEAKKEEEKKVTGDEFDGSDDEDAIEALEELANSSVNGDTVK